MWPSVHADKVTSSTLVVVPPLSDGAEGEEEGEEEVGRDGTDGLSSSLMVLTTSLDRSVVVWSDRWTDTDHVHTHTTTTNSSPRPPQAQRPPPPPPSRTPGEVIGSLVPVMRLVGHQGRVIHARVGSYSVREGTVQIVTSSTDMTIRVYTLPLHLSTPTPTSSDRYTFTRTCTRTTSTTTSSPSSVFTATCATLPSLTPSWRLTGLAGNTVATLDVIRR